MCIEGVVHGVCGTVIPMGQVPQQFQNLEENNNIQRSYEQESYLDAFCACDGLHLLVTPVQLMRPAIGENASCTVGDFTL